MFIFHFKNLINCICKCDRFFLGFSPQNYLFRASMANKSYSSYQVNDQTCIQIITIKITLILVGQTIKVMILLKCVSALLLLLTSFQIPFPYNLYALSPPFPPTAYVGHYYTCTFRVSGLINPEFTFSNLPEYFISSNAGTIQGIPKAVGSFTFNISFRYKEIYSSQQIVLCIAPPIYPMINSSSQRQQASISQVKTMYQTGDRININLNQNNTIANQLNWSYLNLPQQLKGDSNGQLRGVFKQEGMYTFAAFAYDQYGNSNDYLFTFNIQSPKYISFDYRTHPQVPPRNLPFISLRQSQILCQQKKINVQLAQKQLQAKIDYYEKAKQHKALTIQLQKRANKNLDNAQTERKIRFEKRGKAIAVLNTEQIKVNKSQNIVLLKEHALKQAKSMLNNTQLSLNRMSSLIDRIRLILLALSNLLSTCQKETSRAEAKYESALRGRLLASEDYNVTFQALLDAKSKVQQYTQNLSSIQFQADTAKTQRAAVNLQNDIALSAYHSAQSSYNKTLKSLENATAIVSNLRRQEQQAKVQLGNAKFKLNQALNNLYVAQAAKAQSDKAITISSPISEKRLQSFSGCQSEAYPLIVGSCIIVDIAQDRFKLSSGYTLIYGKCTIVKGVPLTGDIITFSGYLRKGYINAVKIQKI